MEVSKDIGAANEGLKVSLGIIYEGDFSMEKIE